jgi:hypothetical protein
LIRTPTAGGPRWEAYDLDDDPGETHDIYDPVEHAELRASLTRWLDRMSVARTMNTSGSVVRPPGRRTRRELRALGYLD